MHGTFNTLLGAGRTKLGIPEDGNLAGRLFVSAGLGGMSGAQGKAAEIAGAVSIIAEVDLSRIMTRYNQGWVSAKSDNLDEVLKMTQQKLAAKDPTPSPITATWWTCWSTCMRRISMWI